MSNAAVDLEQFYFSNSVSRDLLRLVVGERLGFGVSRDVYVYLPDPTMVIKFEINGGSFMNILEHQAWESVKHTAHAKWFAPVHKIGDNGIVLIQARTFPVETASLPAQVPAYFTDLKPSNWGRLGNKIVCHDYGMHLMLERGLTKRMRQTDWEKS